MPHKNKADKLKWNRDYRRRQRLLKTPAHIRKTAQEAASVKKRYHSDPEFRVKRIAQVSESQRRAAVRMKERAAAIAARLVAKADQITTKGYYGTLKPKGF